ncbi:MAG: ribonuclease P protein component, partial [Muribaculaceae bacterium]|nr:ribonuclease P protein component [Muribaculaceae bacterium]
NSAETSTHGSLEYPLRALWRINPTRHSYAPLAFLISVPKRRLRHAVDRVAMRRRIREAFRLNRHKCELPDGIRIDLAFVYVGKGLCKYSVIEKAMLRLLSSISDSAI